MYKSSRMSVLAPFFLIYHLFDRLRVYTFRLLNRGFTHSAWRSVLWTSAHRHCVPTKNDLPSDDASIYARASLEDFRALDNPSKHNGCAPPVCYRLSLYGVLIGCMRAGRKSFTALCGLRATCAASEQWHCFCCTNYDSCVECISYGVMWKPICVWHRAHHHGAVIEEHWAISSSLVCNGMQTLYYCTICIDACWSCYELYIKKSK